MNGEVTRFIATVLVGSGCLVLAFGCGGRADDGESAEAGKASTPADALAAWVDLVKSEQVDRACELMTEEAQAGFQVNGIDLPRSKPGRSCEQTVRLAARSLPVLEVGDSKPAAINCREDGDVRPGFQVEWLYRGEYAAWQLVCRVAPREWEIDDRVWTEFRALPG